MKKLIKIIGSIALLISVASAEVNLKVCSGCHGKTFEKSAMGLSKIVKDMNATAISEALIGYKTGTYGGAMKGLMKGQVRKYTIEDLNNTGSKIKNLK